MNFVSFANLHGLLIDSIYPSEKIFRCGTEDKPRSKNGAYFFDGLRGFIFDWSKEARPIWWNDENAKPWTDEEKKQWGQRRKEAEKVKQEGYRNAAKQAQVLINSCKTLEHAYLTNKRLDALGMVTAEKELIIPMRNIVNNELVGAQVIKFDTETRTFSKKMLYGMRAKDAVFRLGNPKGETWLVEGYATGLTVEKALRQLKINGSVLVCFSAHGIENTASKITGKAYVFADNDKSQTGENSARETGLKYCMSPEVGEDANDLFIRCGILAVSKLIMGARAL